MIKTNESDFPVSGSQANKALSEKSNAVFNDEKFLTRAKDFEAKNGLLAKCLLIRAISIKPCKNLYTI